MSNNTPPRLYYKPVLLVLATLVALLGLAVLFYGERDEITLAIPVKIERIQKELIAVTNTPLHLEVRLRGPARILKSVKDDPQICCTVDLSTVEPGPLFLKISPEMIKLPTRVSVVEIDPASLALTVDKRMDKLVPIVPDLRKDPSPGYVVTRVVSIPSKVRITGPATVLEKISAVRTTPIEVVGLTETIMKKVALNLNHNQHVRAIGESLVEVEIVISEKSVEKRLDIPVQAKGSNYRTVITPNRIEVLLKGPLSTLENLAPADGIQAYVDIMGLEPGTYVRRAIINPPLSTSLVKANPEVFTVKVLAKD